MLVMPFAGRYRVYENGDLRRITGDTVRPGGFTLTGRALVFCSFTPGARVLDVGCGTGATVEHLITRYKLDAVGVDPSPVLLEQGRRRCPGLPLLEAAGESLPFGDGEMDGVFMECALTVMEDPDGALAECYRVLKDGGRLVVTDVYARNPEGVADLRKLPAASCLTGAMGGRELKKKIERGGFAIVLWEDHSRLLAELAGRIILAGGSLEIFYGHSACGAAQGRDIREAIKKSRPGYFLLIARKQGVGSHLPERSARLG